VQLGYTFKVLETTKSALKYFRHHLQTKILIGQQTQLPRVRGFHFFQSCISLHYSQN